MKKAILATKIGMTQIFAEDGELIPVTVLQAGPCEVTQVKTVEILASAGKINLRILVGLPLKNID